jgi:hypothetical protein
MNQETELLRTLMASLEEKKRCAAIGSEPIKEERPERLERSGPPVISSNPQRGDKNTMNRELLEKPFPREQIQHRKGGFGEVLDYIEGPLVIQRLNEAFQSEWSFKVQEHTILENEVVVLGELTAQGIVKTQFGAKDITRGKADGVTVSIGDDLKAAATDALKKCATLFGVGLHLYLDTPAAETTVAAPQPPAPQPKGNGHGNGGYTGGDGAGRITAKQLNAIFAIAKSAGASHQYTVDLSKSQFGKVPDHLSSREASSFIDYLKGQQAAGPRPLFGGRA